MMIFPLTTPPDPLTRLLAAVEQALPLMSDRKVKTELALALAGIRAWPALDLATAILDYGNAHDYITTSDDDLREQFRRLERLAIRVVGAGYLVDTPAEYNVTSEIEA